MNNNYDYNGMLLQSTHCSLKTRLLFMLALQQKINLFFIFKFTDLRKLFCKIEKIKILFFNLFFIFSSDTKKPAKKL